MDGRMYLCMHGQVDGWVKDRRVDGDGRWTGDQSADGWLDEWGVVWRAVD